MKTKLIFIFAVLLITNIYAQETAVTKDGKTVQLNTDGTWNYIIEAGSVTLPDSMLKQFKKPLASKTLLSSKKVNHALWYNQQKWALSDIKPNDLTEYLLKMKDEDAYCITVVERIEVPITSFKAIIQQNLKARGAESVDIEKEEYRIINGLKVLHMQFTARINSIAFTYACYYFSNENGTSQVLCYTSANLFKNYKTEYENMLNGFVVIKNPEQPK